MLINLNNSIYLNNFNFIMYSKILVIFSVLLHFSNTNDCSANNPGYLNIFGTKVLNLAMSDKEKAFEGHCFKMIFVSLENFQKFCG